jgi:hypothetical protein
MTAKYVYGGLDMPILFMFLQTTFNNHRISAAVHARGCTPDKGRTRQFGQTARLDIADDAVAAHGYPVRKA